MATSLRADSAATMPSASPRAARTVVRQRLAPGDAKLAAAIEAWFGRHRRDLPWRRRRDGYTALVSEAMLQQTQVGRVVERFEAFLLRFPDVRALAEASEEAVLAAWQGLGYYGRARRLHAAARAICSRFGGEVPRDPELLLTLPGVGRYTAGAIASIAFGVRTPIVDTNIARVLMRLDARGGAAASPRTTAWLWDRATSMVTAARDPAALNEGLMELGALVCPAGEPRCPSCPLRSRCAAARQGIAAAIPALAAASPRRCIVHHAIVVLRGERVLLVQRGERGLWASMWQVPTVESGAALEPDALNAAAAPIRVTSPVEEFTHQTSHRSVQFRVHRGTLRIRKAVAGWRWVSASELPSVPLSNPMRRIVLAALGKQATAR